MFTFFQTYSKETFALVGVVFAFALNRIFRLRPKLSYSVRHSSNYLINQPLHDQQGNVIQTKQLVSTASIIAQNTGLQHAKNVEFTFAYEPPIYNVYPGRSFTPQSTGMDRWVLKLESFAPNEQISIEILSINQDLPILTSVRCDEAEGKSITMKPQRVFPNWFNIFVLTQLLIGLATTLFLIASLIEWLAVRQ